MHHCTGFDISKCGLVLWSGEAVVEEGEWTSGVCPTRAEDDVRSLDVIVITFVTLELRDY
jgi:hypothetical protein